MTFDINPENKHALLPVNHDHPGDEDPHKKDEELLPLRQEQALEMMLEGISDSDIAQKIGVTRQTVNHWRNQDKDFRLKLKMRRLQIWESHIDEIAKLYPEAIRVMRMGLNSKDQKIRLRAAIQILRMPALQDNLKNKEQLDPVRLENERLGEGVREILADVAKEYESGTLKINTGSDKTIGGPCSKPPTQV